MLKNLILTLVLLLASSCVRADGMTDAIATTVTNDKPLHGKYFWTLGLDLTCLFSKPKNDFQSISYSPHAGNSVYIAYRLQSIFDHKLGYELGYNWTSDRAINFTTYAGQNLLGNTFSGVATYSGKIRLKNTYFDLYWHRRIAKWAEAKFGVGMGWVHGRIKLPINPSLEGQSGACPRVNVGIQALITKKIGIRGIATYQSMKTVKAQNDYSGSRKMFGDGISFLAGIYWNITGYYYDEGATSYE